MKKKKKMKIKIGIAIQNTLLLLAFWEREKKDKFLAIEGTLHLMLISLVSSSSNQKTHLSNLSFCSSGEIWG